MTTNDSYGFQKPAQDTPEPSKPAPTHAKQKAQREPYEPTDGLWEHSQGHVKLNPKEVAPTIPATGWRLVATAPPGHEFYHCRRGELNTRVKPSI